MSDVRSMTLGPLTICWLDKKNSVHQLKLALTDEEQKKADSIRAAMRKEEFIRSRLLLRFLTSAKTSFLPDADNSPQWPPGLCGSISHKDGHVAVCTTSTNEFHSIGIDVEHARKDISHLKEKICTAHDLKMIDNICNETNLETGPLVALVFSAKEALFKCHFPLGKTMFWFHDAEVSYIDIDGGEIEIKVLTDTSPATPKGYSTRGKFLLHNASDGAFWITAFTLPKT
jgi:enterobactin synthetase component D